MIDLITELSAAVLCPLIEELLAKRVYGHVPLVMYCLNNAMAILFTGDRKEKAFLSIDENLTRDCEQIEVRTT